MESIAKPHLESLLWLQQTMNIGRELGYAVACVSDTTLIDCQTCS